MTWIEGRVNFDNFETYINFVNRSDPQAPGFPPGLPIPRDNSNFTTLSQLIPTTEPSPPSETLRGDGSVAFADDGGGNSDTSSLTSLGSLTPPPGPGSNPDADLEAFQNLKHDNNAQQQEKNVVKGCTHTTWCTCPTRASHASGERIPHLSEWALSAMNFSESAERSTVHRQIDEDAETAWRVQRAAYWSTYLIKTLPLIAIEDSAGLEIEAKRLVGEINALFPPSQCAIARTGETIVEAVVRLVRQWKRDLDFEKLKREFEGLVGKQRKDLVFLFQKFWPRRLRGVSKDETKECEPRAGEVREIVEMVRDLEEARAALDGGQRA